MRLLLIRHALPERDDVVSEAPDPELSAQGHRQAEALAAALGAERLDAVWSSPLRRAMQTAEALAAGRGLTVRQHPSLAEFDFGHGVYIPAEETGHPIVRAMKERLDDQSADDALPAFRRTVTAAIQDVIDASDHESTVAIACHGGVVNAYASFVVDARDVIFANIAYTGLSVFTVSGGGRVRLVSLNEHQHIRDLERA